MSLRPIIATGFMGFHLPHALILQVSSDLSATLLLWKAVKQVAKSSADDLGGGILDPHHLEAGVLTRYDLKAGWRQAESLGQQAQTGLVGPPVHRRSGHSKLQDAVGFPEDSSARCLWLEMDAKGDGLTLLPNQDHYRSRQASSLSEATRNL